MNDKRVISNKKFDRLQWKDIDGNDILKHIKGLTVCDAEPINYPLTEGVVLYFKDADKSIVILCVDKNDDNDICIQLAFSE